MVKRVLALSILGSMLFAAPVVAVPPPTFPISIMQLGGGGGCYFETTGSTTHGKLGTGPNFHNGDSTAHNVSQRDGFWGFSIAAGASKFVLTHAAGSYVASCDGDNAKVVYKTAVTAPAKPTTSTFTVTWADSNADASWTYDVQYRIGTGSWQSWKHGTTKRSATFSGASGKTYFFEARATSAGGTTNWSPARKVVT